MKITLYVRPGCLVCQSVINTVENLTNEIDYLQLQIEDLTQVELPQVQIVPALFVEDSLYSYGELNETRFRQMINSFAESNS